MDTNILPHSIMVSTQDFGPCGSSSILDEATYFNLYGV